MNASACHRMCKLDILLWCSKVGRAAVVGWLSYAVGISESSMTSGKDIYI